MTYLREKNKWLINKRTHGPITMIGTCELLVVRVPVTIQIEAEATVLKVKHFKQNLQN